MHDQERVGRRQWGAAEDLGSEKNRHEMTYPQFAQMM